MNISDEKLSAFLDQELSAQEMDTIRQAISSDASLRERLALLANADAVLRKHAAAIDLQPMPDAVLRLLQAETRPQQPSANASGSPQAEHTNVVALSRWQKTRRQASQFMREHAALAAGIALVIGFAGGQLLTDDAGSATVPLAANSISQDLGDALDGALSGETLTLTDGSTLLSRFSFVDQQARYCRQFMMENNSRISESLACREEAGWELMASAQASRVYQGEYQTASGSSLLDSALDAMMSGTVLSLEEERTLITNQWR